jgi:outer membrane lipoprotein-sorting protein
VVLEVDPERFLIHRFVLKYPDGMRDEYQFSAIQTQRLDAALFEFKPPPGVEVIKE